MAAGRLRVVFGADKGFQVANLQDECEAIAKVATEVYKLAGPIPLKVVIDCEGIIRYSHVGDYPDYPPEVVFVFDELLEECPKP